ncbi:MAG: MarR family transcriptional regulator [Clostridiales bacterium]|nr:MarR family transcriptional regulator [Clostridiales bacterium]
MNEKTISFIEVWDLLIDLQTLMNVLSRKIQTQYGLAPQELRVMLELDRTSSMSVSELSKAINRDFGNVSRTCTALANRGLLDRHKADKDQRVTMMALTEKGNKILEVFYQYNSTVMQSEVFKENEEKCRAMITGMRLFLSFVAERMEELDD